MKELDVARGQALSTLALVFATMALDPNTISHKRMKYADKAAEYAESAEAFLRDPLVAVLTHVAEQGS